MAQLAQNPFFLLAFGVFVGVFSGLMGLGGGAVIIPILVLLFNMDQRAAHGTSLAMILSPTQIPAIWNYHQQGFINWKLVFWILPGMLTGSYFGSRIATALPPDVLRLVFGFILIYVACYTVFGVLGKEHLGRTLVLSLLMSLIAVGIYAAAKWWDAGAGG